MAHNYAMDLTFTGYALYKLMQKQPSFATGSLNSSIA
jgi:hypothetical protein